MERIYQVRKGFDGLFYFREMTGDCRWSHSGFATREEAENVVVEHAEDDTIVFQA